MYSLEQSDNSVMAPSCSELELQIWTIASTRDRPFHRGGGRLCLLARQATHPRPSCNGVWWWSHATCTPTRHPPPGYLRHQEVRSPSTPRRPTPLAPTDDPGGGVPHEPHPACVTRLFPHAAAPLALGARPARGCPQDASGCAVSTRLTLAHGHPQPRARFCVFHAVVDVVDRRILTPLLPLARDQITLLTVCLSLEL